MHAIIMILRKIFDIYNVSKVRLEYQRLEPLGFTTGNNMGEDLAASRQKYMNTLGSNHNELEYDISPNSERATNEILQSSWSVNVCEPS